jgi:hypothetical protein
MVRRGLAVDVPCTQGRRVYLPDGGIEARIDASVTERMGAAAGRLRQVGR